MKTRKITNIKELNNYLEVGIKLVKDLNVKYYMELGIDIKKIRETLKPKISGIYILVNKITGGIYVGSSVNLRERISIYARMDNGKGKIGTRLKKWLNYYGTLEFSIAIITKENTSEEEIRSIEKDLINLYKSKGYKLYNVLKDTKVKFNKPFKQISLMDKFKLLNKK